MLQEFEGARHISEKGKLRRLKIGRDPNIGRRANIWPIIPAKQDNSICLGMETIDSLELLV